MIAHLRGSMHRLEAGEVTVDVQGVGYRVAVPLDVWEGLREGETTMLWISTYVREDRLDLFGFADRAGRALFEELTKITGIGPRLGLELCGVPRDLLVQAISMEDSSLLTRIKGIGKKTAEKLLVELRSLMERKPDLLQTDSSGAQTVRAEYDADAIAALTALGYDTQRVLQAMKNLSPDMQTTEERVAAALRSL